MTMTTPADHDLGLPHTELTATLHLNHGSEILCGPVPLVGEDPAHAVFHNDGPPIVVNAMQVWRDMSQLGRFFFPEGAITLRSGHELHLRLSGMV